MSVHVHVCMPYWNSACVNYVCRHSTSMPMSASRSPLKVECTWMVEWTALCMVITYAVQSVAGLVLAGSQTCNYNTFLQDSNPLLNTFKQKLKTNFFGLQRSHMRQEHLFPLLFPLVLLLRHLLLFFTFCLFPFLIRFTYFLLLSVPSISTIVVSLHFQAGGCRRRPNLGLVSCIYFVLSVLLS